MHETPSAWMTRLVADREVHVWHVRLDTVLHPHHSLRACLSQQEIERSARLSNPILRAQFIIARVAVRHVLATYTGTPARALALHRDTGGKPLLAAEAAPHFSLTHSGTLAAIAVAANPVGIDIEHVRALRHARAAQRVLHPDTTAAVNALDADAQPEALIDAWTLREAHVKAVGGGMFRTPDILPWQPHPAAGLVRMRGRDGGVWSVARWAPAAGTRAALVVRGALEAMTELTWNPDTTTEEEE